MFQSVQALFPVGFRRPFEAAVGGRCDLKIHCLHHCRPILVKVNLFLYPLSILVCFLMGFSWDHIIPPSVKLSTVLFGIRVSLLLKNPSC